MPELRSPANLAEALQLLHDEPAARPLAGGVAILQRARLEDSLDRAYVHLGGVAELYGIHIESGSLRIGAMTTLADIAASPAVSEAAPLLRGATAQAASPGVRAQATVGGNLVAGAAASDPAAALLALGAGITFADQRGHTNLQLSDALARGPAWLPAGSVLVSISVPQAAPFGWGLERLPLRGAADSSVATIAVQLSVAQGRVAGARAWATAVADRPLRLATFESLLTGQHLGALAQPETDRHLRQAAENDTQGTTLLDDARASAWYRASVIVELAVRAAATAARRAPA